MPIPLEEQLEWEKHVNSVYRKRLLYPRKSREIPKLEAVVQAAPQKTSAGSEKYGLIAGSNEKIYCLVPDGKKRFVKAGEASTCVWKFAVFNGVLYHCVTSGAVYDTLAEKAVFKSRNWLQGLAVHEGKLYTCGQEGVFDVFANKSVFKNYLIRDLISYDGKLLGSTSNSALRFNLIDILNQRAFFSLPDTYNCVLILHNNQLYLNNEGDILDYAKGTAIAHRYGRIFAMVSHNSKLYDSGGYRHVFSTLDDPKGYTPLWAFENGANALASIPMSIWNKLAENGKVVK